VVGTRSEALSISQTAFFGTAPSLSRWPTSPVCNQPSTMTMAVSAGSLVIAVAHDGHGRALATTALAGTDPYEMTGSLPAWGATHAAQPDAVLKPGAHGSVAAFGLDILRLGAAEAGVHEVDEASARRR
jgi:hypothetical protein